jgi:hypothetical protein
VFFIGRRRNIIALSRHMNFIGLSLVLDLISLRRCILNAMRRKATTDIISTVF